MMDPSRRQRALRRRIVRTIRDLWARGEPLNLTAVKRRHPELIEEVYSLRPFWGWRNALIEAGGDIDRVPTELTDVVPCELCSHRAAILTMHLLREHEATPEEYREEFPNAPIVSETVRARQMWGRPRIPHWEPVWSPEYALDRLEEHRRRGAPLSFLAMRSEDRSLTAAILHHFGSWDEALRRIGLNPSDIRLQAPGRSLSPDDVVALLQHRQAEGMPLNPGSLEKEDLRLANAALRRFGSFEAAYRAAGIQYESVLQRPRRFTDEDGRRALAEIRRVARLPREERASVWKSLRDEKRGVVTSRFGGWKKACLAAGTTPSRLSGGRFPTQRAVLDELRARMREGKSVSSSVLFESDRSLYQAVRSFFGPYRTIYPLLHLPVPPTGGNRPRYPSREAVIDEIVRRRGLGLPLVGEGLIRGAQADPPLHATGLRLFGTWWSALRAAGIEPVTLQRATHFASIMYPTPESVLEALNRLGLGTARTDGVAPDRRLCVQAQRLFGSWVEALRAAEVGAAELGSAPFPYDTTYSSVESVLEGIRRRDRQGLRMYEKAVRDGPQRDLSLRRAARLCFGSWLEALREAGFHPRQVQRDARRQGRRYQDREAVVAAIRKLEASGKPLNACAVGHNGPLHTRGIEFFGSWDGALRAAGVDPEEVERRLRLRAFHYPDAEAVVEAIRRRHRSGLPLGSTPVQRGPNSDVPLFSRARVMFGSWPAALDAASVSVVRNKGDAVE